MQYKEENNNAFIRNDCNDLSVKFNDRRAFKIKLQGFMGIRR